MDAIVIKSNRLPDDAVGGYVQRIIPFQEKAVTSKRDRKGSTIPEKPSKRRPDACSRGAKDDATLIQLKSQYALCFSDTKCLIKQVRCNAYRHDGKTTIAQEYESTTENIFRALCLPVPERTRFYAKAASANNNRLDLCHEIVRDRLYSNIVPTLTNGKDAEYLLALSRERLAVANIIKIAISAYEFYKIGERDIARKIRKGIIPNGSSATERLLGNEERQNANSLLYSDKILLALLAHVNPADIWGDTEDLGWQVTERELFEAAIQVGRFAAGQQVIFSLRQGQIIVAALQEYRLAIAQSPDNYNQRIGAFERLYQFLRLVADERSINELIISVIRGNQTIAMTPITPVGFERHPLSSLTSI